MGLKARIKRAESKARSDKAWSRVKAKPTRTAVSELRADIRK